jgi:type II/III secretion system protein
VRQLSAVLAAIVVTLLVLARAQAEPPPAEPQASPATEATPASGPSATASGAAAPTRPSPLGMRIFGLHYKKIEDVYMIINPYVGPRGSVKMQPAQRTLTVQDAPENLQRIAALIGSYDVPPKNVEVSVQLILASAGAAQPEPAPPPIRGVIDRLSALNTRWTDYKMVGNARVLGTEGERSSLRVGDDYKVDFRIDQVSDESRVIRFKPFELLRREAVVEGPERYASVLNTVLNLRDSQLFIVGASKVEQSNRALFMTITASSQRP